MAQRSVLFAFKPQEGGSVKLGLTVIGKKLEEVISWYRNYGPRNQKVKAWAHIQHKGIYFIKDEGNNNEIVALFLIGPIDVNHLRNVLTRLYATTDFSIAMGFGQSVILERFWNVGLIKVLRSYKKPSGSKVWNG